MNTIKCEWDNAIEQDTCDMCHKAPTELYYTDITHPSTGAYGIHHCDHCIDDLIAEHDAEVLHEKASRHTLVSYFLA